MDEIEYRKMFAFEDAHWWFRGKRAVIARMLERHLPQRSGRRLLDVGCGTGANLQLLRRYGTAFGIDMHPLALSLCRQRGQDTVARATSARLPYRDATFDAVTILDVLYHRAVQDVDDALGEAARVCRPDGVLLVTDSAFEFLRGPHDVAYHAARRFRRRELAAEIAACGFTVLKCSYANTLLFPMAMAVRVAERARYGDAAHSSLALPAPAVNGTLAAIYGFEARLLQHMSFPIGLSVLIVARRTGG